MEMGTRNHVLEVAMGIWILGFRQLVEVGNRDRLPTIWHEILIQYYTVSHVEVCRISGSVGGCRYLYCWQMSVLFLLLYGWQVVSGEVSRKACALVGWAPLSGVKGEGVVTI